MQIFNRVVPVLLLKDGLLFKTQGFRKPVYVGDPLNAVKIFNEKEVDELVILDIGSGRLRRPPDWRTLELIASEAFVPVAYGGGVTDVATAQRVIALGMEKVVVTSAWNTRPELINDLVSVLGSQAVVAGIDYRRRRGRLEVFSMGGSRRTGLEVHAACADLVARGAGELLLQSIDSDGAMTGMDLDTVASVSDRVQVPILAVGGAGRLADLEAALGAGASAVGAGSLFVFHGRHRAVLITYPNRKDLGRLVR